MGSVQNISCNEHEEADILQAMHLASISSLPFGLKVAVDVGLLEIISKADTPSGTLSAAEIVSQLPTKNPDAPSMVDRILRLLTTHSILTCKQITGEDGQMQRKYMKDMILEGGFSSERAFGKHLFELQATDDEMSKNFNRAMSVYTDLVMNQVLQTYNGFEGVSQVVDVGGGLGTNLKLIVSKYPQIKAINFDLPQVIKDTVPCPGVEHLAGDMFTEIPKSEVIFMKTMLHDWGDDQCLKLLKVCYDALSKNGKIVSIEAILSDVPQTDIITKTTFQRDVYLCHVLPGAKERTKQEFETLAKQAGFSSLKVVCRAYNYWVMEIYKSG
ncbi:Caffeic acid 3-O-methyltransferase 1 isoform 2 [Hibiscus syriacus]|uniref:Caffeic acid 3-O-methyltransferase 1 isoform 2 n=1 Tax=Hibiscus syriacus TaxID=106335 RepID=A0A6A2WZV2_HIBSY|nr:Caffeic acid 3-O-methyltransferase 1 isoform 2 [Hibiscus syriacus]